MKLEDLTTEEIKDILTQLLIKVECDKELVEKNLKFRDVYKHKDRYCINFYNGFEHKVCSINNDNADISSESVNENRILTKIYLQILQNTFDQKKHDELIINV